MEHGDLVFVNGAWDIVQSVSMAYPNLAEKLKGFDNTRTREDGFEEFHRSGDTDEWVSEVSVFGIPGVLGSAEADAAIDALYLAPGQEPGTVGDSQEKPSWWPSYLPWPPKLPGEGLVAQTDSQGNPVLDAENNQKFVFAPPIFDFDGFIGVQRAFAPKENLASSINELIAHAIQAGNPDLAQALKDFQEQSAPSGQYSNFQEAQAAIDADSRLQALNFRPEQTSGGAWIIRAGPAAKPEQIASSLDELIAERIANSDYAGARKIRAFQQAPSQLDLFNTALTAVQSPAEFFLLQALLEQGGGIAGSFASARAASAFGLQQASPFRQNGQQLVDPEAAAQRANSDFAAVLGNDPQHAPGAPGVASAAEPPKPPNIQKLKESLLRDINASGAGTGEGFDVDQYVIDAVDAKVAKFNADVAAFNAAKKIRTPTERASAFATDIQSQVAQGRVDTGGAAPVGQARPVGTQFMLDVAGGAEVPQGHTFPDLGESVPRFVTERQALTETSFQRDLRGNKAELAGIPRADFHQQEQQSFRRLGGSTRPGATERLGQRRRVGV